MAVRSPTIEQTARMIKALCLGALLAAGCATRTGSPVELVIHGRSTAEVKRHFTAELVELGWLPLSGENLVLTFQRRSNEMDLSLYNITGERPENRQLRLTLSEAGADVRLFATLYARKASYFDQEGYAVASPSALNKVNEILREIADGLK